MNAAEHFAWAKGRALEYVEAGDGASALGSLLSDLGKHEGTAGILLDPALRMLFAGELMLGSVEGARRFIEGLLMPVDASCARCSKAAAGTCCSSHGKKLCHLCYRRTHFVEVCVEGCRECAAEGLPVLLSAVAR